MEKFQKYSRYYLRVWGGKILKIKVMTMKEMAIIMNKEKS